MPVVASVRNSVAVSSALADSQHSRATVLVDNGDSVAITANISDDALIAGAAPVTQLAIRLSVDLGTGLTVLPASEPPIEFTIRESADEISDTLRFQLAGPQWNPHLRAFGRALSRLQAEIGYGSPGSRYFAKVFTGYVAEAPYSFSPPILSVLALDGAAKHRYKRLKDYMVDADSGRTRLDILREMLALADIPHRAPDLGPNDGGTVNKPVVPGEAYILEFIRDWLSVLDVEVGFIADDLVIQRFDPNGIAVADLHARHVERGGLSVVSPATLDPNTISSVAISYQRQLPDGETGDVTVVETIAPHALQTWVSRINDSAGTLQHRGGGQQPESARVISRVTTKNTKIGTLVVRSEQVEEAIYAPFVARLIFKSSSGTPGEIGYRAGSYLFPDGTWRNQYQESLRVVRLVIEEKSLDEEKRVTRKVTRDYHYRFAMRALYVVDVVGTTAEDDIISQGDVPLLEDGNGVVDAIERIGGVDDLLAWRLTPDLSPLLNGAIPDRYALTEYALDDDGLIASEKVTERFPNRGVPRSSKTDGAYGYGLENREYMSQLDELPSSIINGVPQYHGRTVTQRTYRALNEDEFETIETTITNGRPETRRTVGSGTRPAPERVEPETITQELRAVAVDDLRAAMTYTIEDFAHNEYIENRAEAEGVAEKELRRRSAMRYTINMPIEGQIHKWMWITVNMPRHGLVNMRMYVREVERNVARFRQTVRAEYYPTLQ